MSSAVACLMVATSVAAQKDFKDLNRLGSVQRSDMDLVVGSAWPGRLCISIGRHESAEPGREGEFNVSIESYQLK